MNQYNLNFVSPQGTRRLKINVHERVGFTPAEIEKHKTAMLMLETVVNSVEFRDRMLAIETLKTGSKSRIQLYTQIMSGAETLDPEVDYEMDIWVTMYYENSKVVGFTKESTFKTWLNRKFITFYVFAEVACNAFHEWLHKLGWDHANARDYNSVPYALGYLIESMIKELVNGAKFTDIDAEYTVITEPESPVVTPEKKYKVVCSRSWRFLWLKRVCYRVEV